MPEEVVKTVEESIAEDLEIDSTNLDEEMLRQPSKFMYWGAMWARLVRAKDKQKLVVKEVESRIWKQLNDGGDKKPTEAQLRAAIYADDEYIEQARKLTLQEYSENLLAVAKDAFKQRGQALLELRRHSDEAKFFGDEFKAMQREFEERHGEKPKRRRTVKEHMEETT